MYLDHLSEVITEVFSIDSLTDFQEQIDDTDKKVKEAERSESTHTI